MHINIVNQNAVKLTQLIGSDPWRMEILREVRSLHLPDWAIGAGFIRSKVWDDLSSKGRSPPEDVDVLFFDPIDISSQREKELEQKLYQLRSEVPWSVKNQARMHIRNNNAPYKNTEDAMKYWLETPTAVAIRLEANDQLCVFAPFGLDDLFQMIIRPTPAARTKMNEFEHRISNKPWLKNWSDVRVIRD